MERTLLVLSVLVLSSFVCVVLLPEDGQGDQKCCNE